MPEISPGLYRAGEGEPLLLLHGFTGTWHHWRPLLAELVARYEVIAPTLAGHDGGPPFPIPGALSFKDAADSLEGHLDEIGVGTAHVVGNSLGGALAIELAERGRARSVVALAPAGGWTQGDREQERIRKFFVRQMKLARFAEPRAEFLMRFATVRRIAFRDIMRRGHLVDPPDAVDLVRTSVRCSVFDQAILSLREGDPTLHDLHAVKCPVLLAWPEKDRVLPLRKHSSRFLEELPGCELRVLEGSGHVPMWDDPRAVTEAIVDWVDRHTAAAPAASEPAVA